MNMDRLKDGWLDFTDRIARLDLPPFMKLGLLIAVAVLPFAAFVALQDEPEPETEPTPLQRAIDTSQQVPLIFPFGGNPDPVTPVVEPEVVEMSPSPEPTPTRSLAVTQCSNGRDDDRDGMVDLKDPGCSSRTDKTESPNPASPKPPAPPPPPPPPASPPAPPPASPPASPPAPPPPSTPPPTPPPSPTGPPPPQCSDGVDNDDDGNVDMEDVLCRNPQDDSE
jgi:hypothetical protein